MELILGQARRRWSKEQKLALVAEAMSPGASVNSVAKRHGVNPGVLFAWRKQFRDELRAGDEHSSIGFAAVTVSDEPSRTESSVSSKCDGRLSIEFASGDRMIVTGGVDPSLAATLTRILSRR